MTSMFVTFEHICISVDCHLEDVTLALRQELGPLISNRSLPMVDFSVKIHGRGVVAASVRGGRVFQSSQYTAYGWGKVRCVKYNDGSFLTLASNSLEIFPGQSADVRERSKLMILSIFGECLEQRGWVRLHALGFVQGPRLTVYLGGPGSGKSTVASKLLNSIPTPLLSDEILFERRGTWIGIPLPVRLQSAAPPKQIIPWQQGSIQKFRGPVGFQVLAENRWSAFSRWIILVISGYGLPQMAEIYLRSPRFPTLVLTFLRRLKFALKHWALGRVIFRPKQSHFEL